MSTRMLGFFFLVLVLSGSPARGSSTDLIANLVKQANSHDVIIVPPGHYTGQLVIEKSVRLFGHGKVWIQGPGRGTVVKITAHDVEFDGFRISGSGESHTDSDAAVEVTGARVTFSNNLIEDSFFGVKILGVREGRFVKNMIRSYLDRELADRGDGFFVWNSSKNVFNENDLLGVRDFSLNNSDENVITNNQVRKSRTAIYLVFSPRTLILGNLLDSNSTGVAALYSPDVRLEKNRITHSLEGSGSCISTKDSMGTVILENQLVHCAVGYQSDSPLGENLISVDKNLIAHNFVATRIYGQKGSHRFRENVFYENLVTMILPLDGPASGILWQKNYWDEYQGFGREPYQNIIFADRIWLEIPKAQFFSNSPFFELIDFLERLAPFSSPTLQAQDNEPQSLQSEVYLRHQRFFEQ